MAQIETIWEEITSAALLGTERRAFVLPSASGPLVEVLNGLGGEGQLLGAAAAVALYRRAGRKPGHDSRPLPEACSPEELPPCSSASSQHLALMLGGQYKELLPEWLSTLHKSNKLPPQEYLPALLDLGRNQSELREAIGLVLGKRGKWLAEQNPRWNYITVVTEETNWETGSSPARLVLLQNLRQTDPNRARELLLSTWKEEKPEDRAAFLEAFTVELSMEDEPLLEESLDDRRKEVRRTASELLARLPESHLSQRMLKRVQPLLNLKKTMLNLKTTLEVTLPEACDKAMIRDGIEAKPQSGMGEKAWWLAQMLGVVPPSYWTQAWNKTPEDLLKLAWDSEWNLALIQGWNLTTTRHRDLAWAEALLDMSGQWNIGVSPEELLELLPMAQREQKAVARLWTKPGPLNYDHSALPLLRACPKPWSADLSRLILVRLQETVSSTTDQYGYYTRSLLKEFIAYFDSSLVDEAAKGWPTAAQNWSYISSAVDEFIAGLQFRYDLRQELGRGLGARGRGNA